MNFQEIILKKWHRNLFIIKIFLLRSIDELLEFEKRLKRDVSYYKISSDPVGKKIKNGSLVSFIHTALSYLSKKI